MNEGMIFQRVSSLSNKGIDKDQFFEAIGKHEFVILYDFNKKCSFFGLGSNSVKEKSEIIKRSIAGIDFDAAEAIYEDKKDFNILSCYRKTQKFEKPFLHEIFDSVIDGDFLAIVFMPVEANEIRTLKTYIEEGLNQRVVSETHSVFKNISNKRINATVHREVFDQSEEAIFLSDALESMNNAILINGLIYKIFFLFPKESEKLESYLKSKFLILNMDKITGATINDAVSYINKLRGFAFGTEYAKNFLNFYGSIGMKYDIQTIIPVSNFKISLGMLMKNGIIETDYNIGIEPSAMNLGFLISGLPGSGKTTEAMAIIDGVSKNDASKSTKIAIMAPTDEWESFACDHEMNIVKLYKDKVPINFFRCPPKIEREVFYENLAMLISSASNSGPYRNPMEKCMLNAFRKIFANENEPDPVKVYDEIENSIVKFHAKKTNVGIKYTKHGENIKSALENLRSILNRPEYSARYGIKIEELLDSGILFDLSEVSNATKPYLYALILNQIYATAARFDVHGDDELRLLICIEEAQTIFNKRNSAALQDLSQRIQEFRKQGIGLLLLTHNVTDIEPNIRRLCQLKLYLKQAPDTAEEASKDLVFTFAKAEEVALKLKLLESRIGALSYVFKNGAEKITQDTVFIKTKDYRNQETENFENPINRYIKDRRLVAPKKIKSRINIELRYENANKFSFDIAYVRFRYLGEEIAVHELKGGEIFQDLFAGKDYVIQILDRKERIIEEFGVLANPEIKISL